VSAVQVTTISALRSLLARTSKRTRALLVGSTIGGTAARFGFLASAVLAGEGSIAAATALAFASGAALAGQRAVEARARVAVECDLHRAIARALVDGDVLAVRGHDAQRAVFEAEHQARALVSGRLTAFVADALACVVAAPLLARVLPGRVALVAVLALAILGLAIAVLRGVTARAQGRVFAALQRVYDTMLVAVEGRVELVARGAEDAYYRELEARLGEYSRIASRTALGSALVGRLPVAAAAATVATAAFVDGAMREALVRVVLGQALVLATCVPPVIGLVLAVHDTLRTVPALAPLLTVLAAPKRLETRNPGGARVELPAAISVEAVSFRYAEDQPLALAGVSVVWEPQSPLVVVGPNGSGKSTLLRLVLGLAIPQTGVIKIGSRGLDGVDLVEVRKKTAYLPQRPYLGEAYATVREALRLAAPNATDAAMLAALERAGFDKADPLGLLVGELSTGQRQRVALGRILLHEDSRLVLLDEPDANLDRDGILLVVELVEALVRSGKMVAVAAHSVELSKIKGVHLALEALRPEDKPAHPSPAR
jgi:ABC-type bacteriocin/lantibiotic exporter with double-glycine peptidase domain